ncbi:hypothetical protein SLEP1_g6634 [Rubroshorea leprosula]|uniref:Uncharacterized protein n=1 Tax=Rubroshorea leprosula TaxID=152421 RepID=A0AAV5I433_9ROSI|nr:hypothetical protein SLEP1_g6634 [Rubroshorea leprosula]
MFKNFDELEDNGFDRYVSFSPQHLDATSVDDGFAATLVRKDVL